MRKRRRQWYEARRYRLRKEMNGETYKTKAEREMEAIRREYQGDWQALLKRVQEISSGDVQNLDTASCFETVPEQPTPDMHPELARVLRSYGITPRGK